ncbi:hypothetical protein M378DRAFT_751401 [Amanita muscaria Koide BX008]|uniref:Uncharacterized protein n=1 Tax=Amanita muscaria (strain Koide BX008) TaxID=946122 RepID=A0A0C2X1M8_AMAMK|nr:hypothetical protein M378DRAFT_751401 [Amanita muscaria Koide BX008]
MIIPQIQRYPIREYAPHKHDGNVCKFFSSGNNRSQPAGNQTAKNSELRVSEHPTEGAGSISEYYVSAYYSSSYREAGRRHAYVSPRQGASQKNYYITDAGDMRNICILSSLGLYLLGLVSTMPQEHRRQLFCEFSTVRTNGTEFQFVLSALN